MVSVLMLMGDRSIPEKIKAGHHFIGNRTPGALLSGPLCTFMQLSGGGLATIKVIKNYSNQPLIAVRGPLSQFA
jgi:hypothetical protein